MGNSNLTSSLSKGDLACPSGDIGGLCLDVEGGEEGYEDEGEDRGEGGGGGGNRGFLPLPPLHFGWF